MTLRQVEHFIPPSWRCWIFQLWELANDHFWADQLFISSVESPAAQGTLTGRHHLAFQAKNRQMVNAFYLAALAHGGRCNGKPDERAYHPGYYAAYVLDPDGNNIEAVFHGEAQRSAASVIIDI